jgi:Uma2 family endonuclease
MTISAETYERVALEDPDGKWELACGRLRQKPSMTHAHNDAGFELAYMLRSQLDHSQYNVRADAGRVRTAGSYFIPDVFVIPIALTSPFRGRADVLEAYNQPLPLVVEVWSPSTGDYDVTEKLAEYKRRGDAEIWLVHPFERTLTAWRRQPDGAYNEEVFTEGEVEPVALPGVRIPLEPLFVPL